MYNKLFTKILDSSIWLEPDTTRIVWITMIAAMDEEGFVSMKTPQNVANRALISLPAALTALHTLENEDPADLECPHRGRRLERVSDGWMVLKANEYREIVSRSISKKLNRDRVANYRARRALGNGCVTGANDSVMQSAAAAAAAAEATTEKKEVAPLVEGLDAEAWSRWLAYRQEIKKPLKSASLVPAQKEMAKLGNRQMAAVEHSMANGWTGLFAPDAKKAAKEARRWE